MLAFAALSALALAKDVNRTSEVWTREQEIAHCKAGGFCIELQSETFKHPRPQDYLTEAPSDPVNWCDKDGVNYCSISRNQHIPQYCGSCWAHGSVSALADRVKIARKGQGVDINPSVQHILNCADVGSCHGGSVTGPYSWLSKISKKTGTGISYETSNPYMACSSESRSGFCGHADWSCTPENIAKTCSTFPENGGTCTGLDKYPNITISDYGSISGAEDMAKEIAERGPIACGIDAGPILQYDGGIIKEKGDGVDHVISVTGWGEEDGVEYWIVRNSWGEYWGNMGYVYVEKGNNALQLESQCAWAVVEDFTDDNFKCDEDGANCKAN
jgi:cathepsin X